jgi:hypothetical protein
LSKRYPDSGVKNGKPFKPASKKGGRHTIGHGLAFAVILAAILLFLIGVYIFFNDVKPPVILDFL